MQKTNTEHTTLFVDRNDQIKISAQIAPESESDILFSMHIPGWYFLTTTAAFITYFVAYFMWSWVPLTIAVAFTAPILLKLFVAWRTKSKNIEKAKSDKVFIDVSEIKTQKYNRVTGFELTNRTVTLTLDATVHQQIAHVKFSCHDMQDIKASLATPTEAAGAYSLQLQFETAKQRFNFDFIDASTDGFALTKTLLNAIGVNAIWVHRSSPDHIDLTTNQLENFGTKLETNSDEFISQIKALQAKTEITGPPVIINPDFMMRDHHITGYQPGKHLRVAHKHFKNTWLLLASPAIFFFILAILEIGATGSDLAVFFAIIGLCFGITSLFFIGPIYFTIDKTQKKAIYKTGLIRLRHIDLTKVEKLMCSVKHINTKESDFYRAEFYFVTGKKRKKYLIGGHASTPEQIEIEFTSFGWALANIAGVSLEFEQTKLRKPIF